MKKLVPLLCLILLDALFSSCRRQTVKVSRVVVQVLAVVANNL